MGERFWIAPEWLWTGEALLQGWAVAIKGNRIQELVPQRFCPLQEPLESEPIWMLSPGLIDLQVNGLGGIGWAETMRSEDLVAMHRRGLRFGVTSLLPTLVSSPLKVMEQAVRTFREAQPLLPSGLLGLHFEGPYLNPKRKGIHEAAHLRPLEAEELRQLVQWRESIALMTLAPECVGWEAQRSLLKEGFQLALGHSEATFEVAMEAFEQGIRAITHLFNAMPPLQGRSPGILGALLRSPQVTACLICDGHHIHPAHAAWLSRFPNLRLALVTDALKSAGSHLKRFEFCGQAIEVKHGACQSPEGQLAGAHLTLEKDAHHWMNWTGLPWHEALRLVTARPAELLGLEKYVGFIRSGAIANLVAWKAPGAIQKLWFCGETVEESPGEPFMNERLW